MPEREAEMEDLRRLIATGSRRHFEPYRKMFLIWGIILPIAGGGSELLARLGESGSIPFLWLALVALSTAISIIASRRIQLRTGVKPALLGYHTTLWLGGSGCIVALFIIGALGGVFPLVYLPALSLPVISLCALVSGALFRSRDLYTASACFLLGAVPAVIFPERGSLIQAALLGVALIVLGSRRNG
jgi:hypothetical protein